MSISDSAKRPSASDSAATNFPEFVAADCCPYYLSTTAESVASPSRYRSPNSYDSLVGVILVVLASAYFAVSLVLSYYCSAYPAAVVVEEVSGVADAVAVTSHPTSSCCCSRCSFSYRYWYRTINAVGHRQVSNVAVACAVAGVVVAEIPAAAAIGSVLVDPFPRSLDIR